MALFYGYVQEVPVSRIGAFVAISDCLITAINPSYDPEPPNPILFPEPRTTGGRGRLVVYRTKFHIFESHHALIWAGFLSVTQRLAKLIQNALTERPNIEVQEAHKIISNNEGVSGLQFAFFKFPLEVYFTQ
jgi:hypothetical protein